MTEQRPAKPPAGFRGARRRAQRYLENRDQAAELLRKASEKAIQKKSALKNVWEDLMALFRLLKAWISGDYRGVTWQTILLVLTAVLYFVMPLDVIPDFIAMLGFIDDAAIIAYVVNAIRDELNAFMQWEKKGTTMADLEQLPAKPKSSDENSDGSG